MWPLATRRRFGVRREAKRHAALPRTARCPGARHVEKGRTRKVALDVLPQFAPLRPEDRSRSRVAPSPDRATSRRAARGKRQDAQGGPRRPSAIRPAATGGPVAVQSCAFPGPRDVPARSTWKKAGRARWPSTSFRNSPRCDRRTGRGPGIRVPDRSPPRRSSGPSKAPSPLRSAGALQNRPVSGGARPASTGRIVRSARRGPRPEIGRAGSVGRSRRARRRVPAGPAAPGRADR